MRRAAFGLLVASTLGGCNQIFGLDETTPLPDAPEVIVPDAMWASIQIGFLQLAFDPSMPVPAPAVVPFPDLASVEVGTPEGPLGPRPVDAMGRVTIPLDITTAGPFRLVYQRTGDPIVHEYQGLVPDAKIVEALFGPVARTPPPVGAGFTISPSNNPPNHTTNRVFTMGTWTEGRTVVLGAGNPTLEYDYALGIAESMSGAFTRTAPTDVGFLVDYDPNVGSCPRRSIGSADFPAGVLSTAHTPVTGVWASVMEDRTSTTPLNIRIPADAGPFGDEMFPTTFEHYGFIPSDQMPAFTRAPDPILRGFSLLGPVMFSLRMCTTFDNNTIKLHEPLVMKDKLDRALYTEVTVNRPLPGGGSVDNGFGALTLGISGLVVDPMIAFAKNAKLAGATTVDLWTADGVSAPAGNVLTLSWEIAAPTTTLAHYWDVTVIALNGAMQTKKRIYTTAKPEVKIQSADLPAGAYVLQISAFRGRPEAGTKGDYASVTGNQAMSIVHTRKFVVP